MRQAKAKFTVKVGDLREALKAVFPVTERKNTIPVLGNLLVEPLPNQARIVASDLDLQIAFIIPAKWSESSALTLDAKLVNALVQVWPDAEIECELFGMMARLSSVNLTAHVPTLPASEFPVATGASKELAIFVGADLAAMTRQVRHALTSEDSRYFLNGGQLQLTDTGAVFVATDGHRMHKAMCSAEVNQDTNLLIARKAMAAIIALFDIPEKVTIGELSGHLDFWSGNIRVIQRKIDANFPAYERVIPKNSKFAATFDREIALDAIGRVALLANPRSKCVQFTPKPNTMTLAAQDAGRENASATCAVPLDFNEDGPLIPLNGDYVRDLLAVMTTDRVCVEWKDEFTQLLFREVGGDFVAVLMPMRI